MIKRILAATVVVAALVGLLVFSQLRPRANKISGFIEADEIRLGSRQGGRVQAVLVEEGQTVQTGAVLLELAPFDLLDQRSQAAAQVELRQAELDKLTAGFRAEEVAQAKAKRDELAARLTELEVGPRKETIEAARARLNQFQAELAYARSNFERVQGLIAKQAATAQERDQAKQSLDVAQSRVQAAQAELAELLAGTRAEDIAAARAQLEQAEQAWQLQKNGPRKEDIAAARAALQSSQAALQAIDTRIAELKVRSPIDGVIESLDLRKGDLVGANAPALSMIDPARLWVRAFLPEDMPGAAPGAKVYVTVDNQPGRRFAAHVAFVARQAEFTPSNIQTPEKRSQQVFRVKVYLDEGLDVLRPGMPADVWLEAASQP